MATGDVMFVITTNGYGTVMLENEEGRVLQRRRVTGESDEAFVNVVRAMLEREMVDQYTRA